MEKHAKILHVLYPFDKGYFIELECCICYKKQTFANTNITFIEEEIANEGWVYLESDEMQISGYYCGCEYLD